MGRSGLKQEEEGKYRMKQEEKTRQQETLNMNVGDFSHHDCQINQETDDENRHKWPTRQKLCNIKLKYERHEGKQTDGELRDLAVVHLIKICICQFSKVSKTFSCTSQADLNRDSFNLEYFINDCFACTQACKCMWALFKKKISQLSMIMIILETV